MMLQQTVLELLVLFPAGTAWEVHYDISVR